VAARVNPEDRGSRSAWSWRGFNRRGIIGAHRNEALLKALELRVAALQRRIASMKKAATPLRHGAKFVAVEKPVAPLATAVANRKAMKPEHQQAIKATMTQAA
jgi:hypothetical protein